MRSLLLAVAVALSACATVHHAIVRSDYDEVDRTKTVRLVVFTAPTPEGGENVARLWNQIARKYANDHRDFIVKGEFYGETDPAELCKAGVEGVLRLAPTLRRVGAGVEASVVARLTRCRDGELVWSAEAGGTWPSDDEHLTETTQHYADELGPEVRPYVAPTFNLLRAVLETLPSPKLPDDEAVMEKIELGG